MQQPKTNNIPTNHKLSVLIHQDGLCFYSYDHLGVVKHEVVRTFKHALNPLELLEAIKNVYEFEPALQEVVRDFQLVYHHDLFALVPEAVFQEDKAPDYLKYNARLIATDVVSIDEPMTAVQARCVYIAFENINNYFHDTYGTFTYHHYTSKLVPALHHKAAPAHDCVFVTIKLSYVYITLFKNGRLLLHNIFTQDAPEDILYYTMFATSHNGFDPETMKLTVIQAVKNESVYNLLYTYVRHIDYLEDSEQFLKNIVCA